MLDLYSIRYQIAPALTPAGKCVQMDRDLFIFHSREDVFRFVYWGRMAIRLAAIEAEAAQAWEMVRNPLYTFAGATPFDFDTIAAALKNHNRTKLVRDTH